VAHVGVDLQVDAGVVALRLVPRTRASS
jgi:hypothetical protein